MTQKKIDYLRKKHGKQMEIRARNEAVACACAGIPTDVLQRPRINEIFKVVARAMSR